MQKIARDDYEIRTPRDDEHLAAPHVVEVINGVFANIEVADDCR